MNKAAMVQEEPSPFESFETARLKLRCICRRDALPTSQLMTEPVSRWVANWPCPFSEEMAAKRIAMMRRLAIGGDALPLAITRKPQDELIGWIGLVRNEDARTHASLGYWLGEVYQGQGYMGEALATVIGEGFLRLDLQTIEAAAQPENAASIALMRACGMLEKGMRSVFAPARNRDEPCIFFEIERPQSW
jgi:ribosomal-protein-alanine N-acetyltransferase